MSQVHRHAKRFHVRRFSRHIRPRQETQMPLTVQQHVIPHRLLQKQVIQSLDPYHPSFSREKRERHPLLLRDRPDRS